MTPSTSKDWLWIIVLIISFARIKNCGVSFSLSMFISVTAPLRTTTESANSIATWIITAFCEQFVHQIKNFLNGYFVVRLIRRCFGQKESLRNYKNSIGFWRRARDSNSRNRCNGLHDFQSCSFDQLGQLSVCSTSVLYTIIFKKSSVFSNFFRSICSAPPVGRRRILFMR